MFSFVREYHLKHQVHVYVSDFINQFSPSSGLTALSSSLVDDVYTNPKYRPLFKKHLNGRSIEFEPGFIALFVMVLSLNRNDIKKLRCAYSDVIAGLRSAFNNIEVYCLNQNSIMLLQQVYSEYQAVIFGLDGNRVNIGPCIRSFGDKIESAYHNLVTLYPDVVDHFKNKMGWP